VEPADDRVPLTRAFAPVVFALLVMATVGAFAYAQRLKREPLILDKVTLGRTFVTPGGRVRHVTAFSPNGDCLADNARIRFRVTRSDRANVQIVDPDGRLVRTLVRDRFVKRYRFATFHWDGRDRFGRRAPPGRYKLRVVLTGQDRALTPGGTLRLHLVEPRPKGCRRAGKGQDG
jgi:FlgD Ig-like domain